MFDNEIDRTLTAEFLADPRHHIAVALDGDIVVGFASAIDYVHPDKPAELWINEVGVAPTHQRQGIGRRLMLAVLDFARQKGFRGVWVATDDDNEAAKRLYETVGGRSEDCVVYGYEPCDEVGNND